MKRFLISLPIFIFLAWSNFFYEVNAETIPYNPDFPKAEYPYSQAPDGCSGFSDPRQVRDTWGPVDFKPSCNNHDRCYYTVGSDWKNCNERFRTGLSSACYNDLRIWIPGIERRVFDFATGKFEWVPVTEGAWGPPLPQVYQACIVVAHGYYAGVQAGIALNIFNEAQKKQRKYEEWVAGLRARDTHYALTCLSNSSPYTINYSVKWGNGDWAKYSLSPDHWRSHYSQYSVANENKSPALVISFDSDMSARSIYKQYSLRKFAVPKPDCSRLRERDVFTLTEGGAMLDLFFNGFLTASYEYAAAAEAEGDSVAHFAEEGEEVTRTVSRPYSLDVPGACTRESPRFLTMSGGCADRSSTSGAVFSKPRLSRTLREEAFEYCDSLVESGFDDWQVPPNLMLEEISGRPYENGFLPAEQAVNGVEPVSFWTSSVAPRGRNATVELSCPDERKDENTGHCESSVAQSEQDKHSVLCWRSSLTE